jgi:signal transduction histidine kinase
MEKDLALAGLAHDLNNVLQMVAQVADLLSTDRQWSHESELLLRCVERGRSILGSMAEEPKLFDLLGVAQRAARGVERISVQVDVEGGIILMGRPLALERALLNLLWNSARAGATRVRIAGSLDGKGDCVIDVNDNGPGIDARHLEKIFEPGFSATSSTGLGLSIVESIVRGHGGSVTASNRGGACFQIRIPA